MFLCTNRIYTYVLKKSYIFFPITKGSVNALMKLAGFSTSNTVKNHCSSVSSMTSEELPKRPSLWLPSLKYTADTGTLNQIEIWHTGLVHHHSVLRLFTALVQSWQITDTRREMNERNISGDRRTKEQTVNQSTVSIHRHSQRQSLSIYSSHQLN